MDKLVDILRYIYHGQKVDICIRFLERKQNMKKAKSTTATTKLSVVTSVILSAAALIAAAGTAIRLRGKIDRLEIKHDIQNAKVGDIKAEFEDLVDKVKKELAENRKLREWDNEINKRRCNILKSKLLRKMGIDDRDIDELEFL